MGLRSKPGLERGGRFGSGLKPGSLPNSELVRAIFSRSEGKRGREVAGPSCIIGFYSTIKLALHIGASSNSKGDALPTTIPLKKTNHYFY